MNETQETSAPGDCASNEAGFDIGASERRSEMERRRDRLAAPVVEESGDETLALLVVAIGAEHYGFPLSHVAEIVRLATLAVLPGVPPHIVGLTNRRGDVLPVIDIRVFFEIPRDDLTDLPLAAVVGEEGEAELAILIDEVVSRTDLLWAEILPPISSHTGLREEYQVGVTADKCLILNLERILADPRLVIDQTA